MATTKAKAEVKTAKTATVKTKSAAKPAAALKASEKAAKTATAVKTKKTAAPKSEPATISQDQVAKRAYEIYLTRNGFSGDQYSDWFQAETELKNRQN